MKATILGKRKVDFSTDDGRNIVGTTVWLGFDDDSDVEGLYSEKTFLSNSVASYKDLAVGADVDVTYNRKGKVISIS